MASVMYDISCTKCDYKNYDRYNETKCPVCKSDVHVVKEWDEWQDHDE